MTRPTTDIADAAPVPLDSIVALTRELVRIPSRGGEDSCEPALRAAREWLDAHGVSVMVLRSEAGEPVGTVAELRGAEPGPTYCLNACLDTAPFGDLGAWWAAPTEAACADGWLYGRGAADSKVAVAIFSHLAVELLSDAHRFHGRLLVFFDGDEHTGRFAGVRSFLREFPDLDGVMIGYPGNDAVIVGARGFYRATVTLHGVSAHSGQSTPGGQNAVEKAALLVNVLGAHDMSAASSPGFPLMPTLTVTGVSGGSGGSGFSVVPDTCQVMIDVRLTPSFTADDARELLITVVDDIDRRRPGRARAHIEEAAGWPAYRLDEDSPVASALLSAAQRHHDATTPARVCGPSNIGNLFFAHGIDATCGFGASYKGVHAPNEGVEINTVPMTYRVYRDAIRKLLVRAGPPE
jgi:succinyl-diaminopimelate desuccinylase